MASTPPPQKTSPFAVAKTVFWSFFGIRKGRDYQSDIAKITPMQAIIGGLIGTAIFIATLVTIVQVVLSK